MRMQRHRKRNNEDYMNNYYVDREEVYSAAGDDLDNNGRVSVFADIDGDIDKLMEVDVPDDDVPILPLRNMISFPGVVLPISVGRNSSVRLIKKAEKGQTLIAIISQRKNEVENPTMADLFETGTIGKVLRSIEMPDGTMTAIVQSLRRVRLKEITSEKPYLTGKVEGLQDILPPKGDKTFSVLVQTIRDVTTKYIRSFDHVPNDMTFAINNIKGSVFLINFVCSNLPIKISEKAELLQIDEIMGRGYRLLELLNREVEYAEIRASIQMRAQEDINKQQRDYYLQQQIKTIQNELGSENTAEKDAESLRGKAKKKKWGEAINKTFMEEVGKLERMSPQSADYSVQLNYLETMLSLPWNEYTRDNLNIDNAERVLNRDHYGMEKVKERILEHLAVLKLNGGLKSPIICLYGPPGVGKTSLGKSIAAALKRKYIRMSLGGVHDEAEIRGHRRTYIGAMPGRIVKGLIKAGSSNPVFVLDEIDKVSSDRQSDPESALLEVLDPEQNTTFHDNYLDVDIDLSHIMFIATANSLNTIPQPLLDRMELIEVSGYITEEKIEIAGHHLVPKELEACGMKHKAVKFGKATLEAIIENYTRESGVRELEKKIGKVLRKIALNYARGGELPTGSIKPADLTGYLGVAEYSRDKYQGNDYAGVVTGLAWTAVGGEILFIESSLNRGKGQLTLTGNLGDVMKESAMLAVEYIKAHPDMLGLDPDIFNHWDIHIHVPEGAIPKDGPSAGITMVTSLASVFTQRKVKANLAMTGEITLRGKVLPVGGIKEKILAAKRAGISEIILCADNKKHIDEIQDIYLKGLTFHYVNDIKEVLGIALTDELVDKPLDLNVKDDKEEKKKADK